MRNNIYLCCMAYNKTNTYQLAKKVFESLGLKEDVVLEIDEKDLPIFRKHLSEMIKRQQSSFRYASRKIGDKTRIFRIN